MQQYITVVLSCFTNASCANFLFTVNLIAFLRVLQKRLLPRRLHINDLGKDLLSHILSKLDKNSIIAASCVCKYWSEAVKRFPCETPFIRAARIAKRILSKPSRLETYDPSWNEFPQSYYQGRTPFSEIVCKIALKGIASTKKQMFKKRQYVVILICRCIYMRKQLTTETKNSVFTLIWKSCAKSYRYWYIETELFLWLFLFATSKVHRNVAVHFMKWKLTPKRFWEHNLFTYLQSVDEARATMKDGRDFSKFDPLKDAFTNSSLRYYRSVAHRALAAYRGEKVPAELEYQRDDPEAGNTYGLELL